MEPVRCVCGQHATCFEDPTRNLGFYVQCEYENCERTGPYRGTADEAIAAWNSDQLAIKLHDRLVEAVRSPFAWSVVSEIIDELQEEARGLATTVTHSKNKPHNTAVSGGEV